ncbi:MAG: hypothetical protein K6B68_07795 [Eubacterium sp.]|nr:hypothetical protein [Eubacterium sp.]
MSTTDDLMDKLTTEVSDERSLEEYLGRIEPYADMDFLDYFRKLMEKHDISKSFLANNSYISRDVVYKILDGSRRATRNNLFALCLAAHFSIDEVEKCLVLSHNQKLYPKEQRDAIIIYAINRNMTIMELNNILYSKHMELIAE